MGSTYTFVRGGKHKFEIYENKEIQELLMKWSMKHQLKIQSYSFNEPFQTYMKNNFVESFFKHPEIVNSLQGFYDSWKPVVDTYKTYKGGCKVVAKDNYMTNIVVSFNVEFQIQHAKFKLALSAWGNTLLDILRTRFFPGVAASNVKVELVPCSVLSMAFFNPLTKPENKIVTSQGSIAKCYYEFIDGFDVSDELRQVLLNEESDKYKLYSPSDRSQFIFRLFQALCLGGKWCQYEDNIQPYLDTTQVLYKDLIRVQKSSNTKQVYVTSVVLRVIAEDANGYAYYPQNPDNIQNFAYLIVDPVQRDVTTLIHQFGGFFDEVV